MTVVIQSNVPAEDISAFHALFQKHREVSRKTQKTFILSHC